MSLCDVVDKFHDEHGLAYTGTAEQTDLSTFHIRFQKVDYLDTRCEHLLVCGEVFKLRCFTVNGISALHVELAHAVDRLAYHIHHSTLDLLACRHKDCISRRNDFQSSLQSIGIVHCDASHGVFSDVLLHFNDELLSVRTFQLQSLVYFGQYFLCLLSCRVEIDIDYRTDNLRDVPIDLCHITLRLYIIFSGCKYNNILLIQKGFYALLHQNKQF